MGCYQEEADQFNPTGNQKVTTIHKEHENCIKKAKTDKEKNLCIKRFCERIQKISIDDYENISCKASPAL